MKIKKKITQEVEVVKKIECDICHKIYCNEKITKDENGWNVTELRDVFELQEFHHINFIGGYGSEFGDGTHVECDICQYCLKNMIIGHCRIK